MFRILLVALIVALCLAAPAGVTHGEDGPGKLKVFVLAGQSNMEGKGSVFTLEQQLKVDGKKEMFQRYRNAETWVERDDVWISYLGRHGRRSGKLTVGYGTSKKDSRELFGPELGFGWTVGDKFQENVLIIKTAWGGKSLDRDFRPPSRGLPESMQAEFDKRKRNKPDLKREDFEATYGHFFRLMIEEIQTVTDNLEEIAPEYGPKDIEFSGFVWFQGWNDQYAPTSVADYEDNMAAFIRDVRKSLEAPNLPFVIGAMGHQGKQQSGKIRQIADAQAAVATREEFRDTVTTIRTAEFWDEEAQAAFEKYWKDKANRDVDRWREFGNDRPYHYLGSPRFFNRAGIAFGDAMIRLVTTAEAESESANSK